ncbi:hypothetical protein Tsubulata_035063 [Turnera subulata]|uniref:CCHC-type domain-containing protein n=1 Tax=Turnera subulata TaxID=218843 RepID=A0A9Q0F5P8_9ROSI|nr:hypothetical protein Tsubulata_035063 [Turnera subulata]
MTAAQPPEGGDLLPPDPNFATPLDAPMPSPRTSLSAAGGAKSFKDALGPQLSSYSVGLDVDSELEPLEGDVSSVMTERGPVISLSDRFRKRIHQQWEDTIMKMWGRSIGYKYLCDHLQRLWGLRGSFRVINLDHNYFLVRLADGYDYLRALTGGPWVVLDHYLTVEPWQPNFEPASHRVTSVVAWIRVLGLSSELFQLAILKEIGNHIGCFIRMDYSTQKTERGRFAKATVELDLSTPLQTETCVGGVWYTIMYENIPQVCFECGRAGHAMSSCPSKLQATSAPNPKAAATSACDTAMVTTSEVQVAALSGTDGAAGRGVSNSKYGDWILVPPKVRQPAKKPTQVQSKGTKNGPRVQTSGSRYGALAVEDKGVSNVAAGVAAKDASSGSVWVQQKGIFINDNAGDHTVKGAPASKRARGQSGYTLSGKELVAAVVEAFRKTSKAKKGKAKAGVADSQVNILNGFLAAALPHPVFFQAKAPDSTSTVSAPLISSTPPLVGRDKTAPSSSMAVAFELRGQGHDDIASSLVSTMGPDDMVTTDPNQESMLLAKDVNDTEDWVLCDAAMQLDA